MSISQPSDFIALSSFLGCQMWRQYTCNMRLKVQNVRQHQYERRPRSRAHSAVIVHRQLRDQSRQHDHRRRNARSSRSVRWHGIPDRNVAPLDRRNLFGSRIGPAVEIGAKGGTPQFLLLGRGRSRSELDRVDRSGGGSEMLRRRHR